MSAIVRDAADLFESIAAEIISAMILGGTMATQANVNGTGFVMFPLVIHAFDLVVSSIGYFMVSFRSRGGLHDGSAELGTPLDVLKRGFFVAGFFSIGTFSFTCRWLLSTEQAPDAWWHFMLCGWYGMVAGYASIFITTYYTSTEYRPVRDIGFSKHVGTRNKHYYGISVGMESTGMPILVVSIAILASILDRRGVRYVGTKQSANRRAFWDRCCNNGNAFHGCLRPRNGFLRANC